MSTKCISPNIPSVNKEINRNTSLCAAVSYDQSNDIITHNHHRSGKGEQSGGGRAPLKHWLSSNLVQEESQLQRSAIQELQSLDFGANTENVLVSKRTFQEFNIRKSISLDKEKVQLSFSSEYIDLQVQNSQLKKKIEELEKQIEGFGAIEQKVNRQMSEYQRRIEDLSNQLANYQKQQRRASAHQQGQSSLIQQKERQIISLQLKLAQVSNLGSELALYKKRVETLEEQHQIQINIQQNQFNLAKAVGQQQINGLVSLLEQKEKEIALLKKTLYQQNPSYFSRNSYSQGREGYISRFKKFMSIIDRKIFISQNKDSSIFCNTIASKSGINNKRNIQNTEYFGLLQQKKSQFLQPQKKQKQFSKIKNHFII